MLKTVSFVLCVSACASVYIAKGKCPTNEEYQLCGPACPRTCEDLHPKCDTKCVEGCFCMPGYLRDANGTCVNADKCLPTAICGDNEEFLPCGTACPATCAVPEPEVCNLSCSMGCFCNDGFYRDEVTHKCVTYDNCTKEAKVPTAICGDNEEFLPCGTACPATCAVPEPEVCNLSCSMGCFCNDGFYRDEVTHKCVTYDNCTKEAKENCFNPDEVYDLCNATCQPSCSEPEPICTKECSSGCVCAPGLLRSPDGECVTVDKCPTTNGTSTNVLTKYLNTISKILHLTAA